MNTIKMPSYVNLTDVKKLQF